MTLCLEMRCPIPTFISHIAIENMILVTSDPLFRSASIIDYYTPGYRGSKGQLQCDTRGEWVERTINDTVVVFCQLMTLEPGVRVIVNK